MSDNSGPKLISCPLCGTKAAAAFTKQGFDIWRCPQCDLRFVHPTPPPEETARVYSAGYFSGAVGGFGYTNYDQDKLAMRRFFETVLDILGALGPRPGRLLDVGAATGFFLKLAQAHGWTAEGVEISSYAAGEAERSGLRVVRGTVESARFSAESFDAVTLLDVLEHVASPAAALKECRRILKPGGLILVNTPDTASWWARFFGQYWHAYCPPEHLSYFNPENLSRLFETSGFRVLRAGRISKRFTPAYVASMLYRWQGFKIWNWLSGRLEKSALNRIVLPLDIRDNFYLVARKL